MLCAVRSTWRYSSHVSTSHDTTRQNAQLKDFLRQHSLPVSGKKEILVNRLLEAAREFGCLSSSSSSPPRPPSSSSPTSPTSTWTAAATSPSDSDISFSLPGVCPPPAGDHHSDPVDEGKTGESLELSPESGNAATAAATAGDETDEGEGANAGDEGGGGENHPTAAGAGLQESAFRKRLKARARDKEVSAKRKAEESFSSSGSGDSEDPDGAIRKVGSGSGRSRSSGSGNRSHPAHPRPTGGPREGNKSAHRPSSSQQRAIAAGKAAVAEVVAGAMGPPIARTPLGSLGSGNVSSATSSGNARGGLPKAGVKSKSATLTAKQSVGSSGGGGGGSGNATVQRKVAHGTMSGSSTEIRRKPLGAGSSSSRKVPTTNRVAAEPRSATETGKVDRVRSSSNVMDAGRGKGSTNALGSAKRSAAGVVATATSDHAKRPKVDGVNGSRSTAVPAKAKTPSFVKPTKSSAGAPSFMKPTKNSGARTFGSDRSAAQAAQHGHVE